MRSCSGFIAETAATKTGDGFRFLRKLHLDLAISVRFRAEPIPVGSMSYSDGRTTVTSTALAVTIAIPVERSSLAVEGCSTRVHANAHQGGLPLRRHLESPPPFRLGYVLAVIETSYGAKRLLVWPLPSAFQIRAAESPSEHFRLSVD